MHVTFSLETAVIRRQFFPSLIQSSTAMYMWSSCHMYTKVNDCVVCGVLAEQTVYQKTKCTFQKSLGYVLKILRILHLHNLFLPPGCLQKVGKFVTFDNVCMTTLLRLFIASHSTSLLCFSTYPPCFTALKDAATVSWSICTTDHTHLAQRNAAHLTVHFSMCFQVCFVSC